MARERAARRYAEAAFAIAQEQGELDRWLADLRVLANVLHEPSLARLLSDPRSSLEIKRKVLGERLTKLVNPLALNLVYLLIGDRRLGLLGDVAAGFEQMYNDKEGIAVADVTTAVPLDDRERDRVAAQLAQVTNRRIELRTLVDPAILGGLVARVGDTLLDGSVRARLVALKRSMAGTG